MKEIQIKLIKVTDVLTKISDDGNEYIRVSFEGINWNQTNINVKISMSKMQWKDLKTAMLINYNSEQELIETKQPIKLVFDEEGFTTSKNPKPLLEIKSGTYKGFSFNFFELNVGVLIQNNYVSKEVFKKDYSKLF